MKKSKGKNRWKGEAGNTHTHKRLCYKLLHRRLGLWRVGNRTPGCSLFVFAVVAAAWQWEEKSKRKYARPLYTQSNCMCASVYTVYI